MDRETVRGGIDEVFFEKPLGGVVKVEAVEEDVVIGFDGEDSLS